MEGEARNAGDIPVTDLRTGDISVCPFVKTHGAVTSYCVHFSICFFVLTFLLVEKVGDTATSDCMQPWLASH